MSSIYKISKWTVRLFCVFLLTALPSCQDDPLYESEEGFLEGYANLRLSFAFTPMDIAQLGSRSSTDLIDQIKDLSVLIYDTSGSLIPGGYFYFLPTTDFSLEQVDAAQNAVGGSSTTVKTCRAEVKNSINIPRGQYRIYAVANMGDMRTDYSEAIKEEATMRTIQLVWNSKNVDANCQMSGWFHKENADHTNTHTDDEDKYPSSLSNGITNVPVITVANDITLHAWLRRAAAKVTIAYDGSGLYDDTWIYLRSVTIRNLPAQCSLLANNAVTKPSELDAPSDDTEETKRSSDIVQGETHFYSKETPTTYKGKEEDYSSYLNWPVLANGNPHYGVHEPTGLEDGTTEEPIALYSYENLQGSGKDKKQKMKDEDQYDLEYIYRDKNSVGTFIEVDAYYVSHYEGNEGSGPIKYRFMLGKDIIDNYDLERNFHYQLTLVFHGTANNIDWHIEYRQEEKPGIYAPDPFYVSYLYGSEMEYPIRVEGDIEGGYIDVTIDRNDWRPWDEYANDYPPDAQDTWEWYGKGYYTVDEVTPEGETDPLWKGPEGTAVWNGFLSLYDTTKRTSTFKSGYSDADWNKKDWYKINNTAYTYNSSCGYDAESYTDHQISVTYLTTDGKTTTKTSTTEKDEGYRRYKVPDEDTPPGGVIYYSINGTSGSKKGYGKYRVVKKGKVCTFYIPLYTRPLIMNTWSSYTGNNPFYSFMRRARIVIRAKINGKDEIRKKTVFQVRRQINPKVIMRRHDNNNCFTVVLSHRTGESRDNEFIPFTSRGPWEAKIVQGEGWEIVGRSSGKTESYIKFTVRPKGKIKPHENKCAMVEVWYHSHSCRHVIYLRQGYAPIDMEADREAQTANGVTALTDNVLWHSFNLWWVDGTTPRETDCPIDDGSFFRRANYTQAIDPVNGHYSYDTSISDFNMAGRYTSDGKKRNVTDPSLGYFWLSPINKNKLAKWENITANAAQFTSLSLYGATVKPPALEDWHCFVDNPKIELGYGIAYGDGASGMQYDPNNAFRHSYISKMPKDPNESKYILKPFKIVGQDTRGAFGVRVCCVVNKTTGAVLVLPLGHTGYGHRCNRYASSARHKEHYGELRYAQRDGLFLSKATVNARPLLYTIYTNYGAVYWTDGAVTTDTAWDINYTTFDFNTYGANGSNDGCFIRLVQPKSNRPSATQPYWDYNQSLMTSKPGY